MPFSRRSSYTLTLAVIATMPAILHAANLDSDIQNALWTCTMENGQDWQCDNPDKGNSQLSEAAAQNATSNTDKIKPAEYASSKPIQQVDGAWVCETNASGGWSCLDNQAVSVTDSPIDTAKLVDMQYASQDWYPISGATKACHGAYIEPAMQRDTEQGSSVNPNKLKIDADRSETQLGGLTRLDGNVELRQQGRYLRSDSAQFDQITNQVNMIGNVQYREPGMLLRGTEAQANAITGETVVSRANYVVHAQSLRGDANRIIRMQDNRIRMEQSTYTTCPPNDESWKIAADSLELDPNRGFGIARHATLKVADTPVFYFPYLEFPIDDRRHSGFLFPSFGYSSEDGLEIAAPYYVNLAPNYDDTLTPKVFTKRGLLLENELRYLNSYGQQALSTGLLVHDNQTNRDRWLIGLDHSGHKGSWSSYIDFNAVSDNKYFDDLGSSLDVDRTAHLDRLAIARYKHKNGTVSLRAHSYQTINSSASPYERLPQLQVKGNYNLDPGTGLQFRYLTDATIFERNIDNLTGRNRVTGSRLHFQPSVSMPMQWSWGYLTPTMSYWLSQYDLKNQVAGQDDSINRSTGVFSINSGLIFDRNSENYSQTLEPRLFALYAPKENQNGIPDFDTSKSAFSYRGLFKTNRFTGLDKIGDSQQISLGVSSAFYASRGNELARLSLGQAYYFADRTVQLNGNTSVDTDKQSNFAAEAYWNAYSDLRLSIDSELDKATANALESNIKVRYSPAINKVVSFDFRYRKERRSQTELSLIWPLAPEWTLLGRWREDWENKQTPETLLGVEYSSCCWKVRVAARRWIEDDSNGRTDSALFLQFVLKGLGGIGNGSDALEDIIGFKEREETNDY